MPSSDPFSSFQCHCHCLAPILAPLLPDTSAPDKQPFSANRSLSPMAARQRHFLLKCKSAPKGSTPTNICGKPVYTNTIWFLQTEIQDGLWSRFEHSALVFHSGSNFLPHPILRMLLSSNDWLPMLPLPLQEHSFPTCALVSYLTGALVMQIYRVLLVPLHLHDSHLHVKNCHFFFNYKK